MRPILSKLRKLQGHAQAWAGETVENLRRPSPSSRRGWLLVLLSAGRGFVDNRGPLRAAALAYTTVLALVPLLAIIVSVSTGFLQKEGAEPIRNFINFSVGKLAPLLSLEQTKDEEEAAIALEQLTQQINKAIENFHSGTLGVAAVLTLILLSISLLSTIEVTLNDIWGASSGRSWMTRLVVYWAVLTLGPLCLLAAFSVTGVGLLEQTRLWIEQFEWLKELVFFLLPAIMVGAALALLYLLVPNTKVDWRAAVIGGLLAGLLLQLNSHLNLLYVTRVVTHHKIYGSLSIIPLFLFGLYVSWCIVLAGAEAAFAFQHRRTEPEASSGAVGQRERERLAFRLISFLGQQFVSGKRSPGLEELARHLRQTRPIISQILDPMIHAGLVVEVAGKHPGYQPARPLDRITAHDLLCALRNRAEAEDPRVELDLAPELARGLAGIEQAEKEAASRLTVQDWIEQGEPPSRTHGSA